MNISLTKPLLRQPYVNTIDKTEMFRISVERKSYHEIASTAIANMKTQSTLVLGHCYSKPMYYRSKNVGANFVKLPCMRYTRHLQNGICFTIK